MANKKKQLLYLTQRIPYPQNKGEKIRHYQVIKYLSKWFEIHLGCLVDDPNDWQFRSKIDEICPSNYIGRLNRGVAKIASLRGLITGQPLSVPFFFHAGLQSWVADKIGSIEFDAFYIASSCMAQYVPDKHQIPKHSVMDFQDVDSDKWRQYADTAPLPYSLIYRREARVLLRYDQATAKRFSASLFVTDPEAALFARLAPEVARLCHCVSQGVDARYFDPEATFGTIKMQNIPNFVFTGNMDYQPNIDAVIWFAREILPRIRMTLSNAEFYVVGGNPSRDVSRLGDLPGVHVTGRVPDVRPYLHGADIAVAPLRISRGIQNKVLEAMAMAKPCVVTPQALEGIEAVPGRDLVVADSVESFAAAAVATLNPDIGRDLARNARKVVLDAYSWPARLHPLRAFLGVEQTNSSNAEH